jgi:hypothetical protein
VSAVICNDDDVDSRRHGCHGRALKLVNVGYVITPAVIMA